MKPIKVLWNGKLLREIYPHATRWQVFKFKLKRLFRQVVILSAIILVMAIVYEVGGLLNPRLQYQTVVAEKEVQAESPVLARIAGCESQGSAKAKGTHYGKTGQVLLRANKNGSTDIGKYQINSVWFAKATELGYDLTKESDNEAFAKWLYLNKGTGDWSASAKCWK